jgi:hypothetical protein
MMFHSVKWVIDDDSIYGNLTCNAPEGSPCRCSCLEGCADICDHEEGDVGHCLAVEWIDAAGHLSEAHTGKDQPLADGPVHVEWDGDDWLWTYPEEGEV